MKENNLDKCIRACFKMVDNEIAIASTMALFMLLCLMTVFMAILALLPIGVTCYYTIQMYKKLFYTSVYGETAVTYQSLPATAAEMTAARIFVAGLGNIISGASYLIIFTILVLRLGSGDLGGILEFFEGFGGLSSGLVSLGVLSAVVVIFAQSALIFLAVAAFNSVQQESKKGIYRFLIVLVFCAGNVLINKASTLLTTIGVTNFLLMTIITITAGLVILVVCFRKTVKLLEEKYALN